MINYRVIAWFPNKNVRWGTSGRQPAEVQSARQLSEDDFEIRMDRPRSGRLSIKLCPLIDSSIYTRTTIEPQAIFRSFSAVEEMHGSSSTITIRFVIARETVNGIEDTDTNSTPVAETAGRTRRRFIHDYGVKAS